MAGGELFLIGNRRKGTLSDGYATVGGQRFSALFTSDPSPGDTLRLGGDVFVAERPNPCDLPAVMARKAQIIQPWDAAYMALRAGVRSGSRVLESGVGSGALSAVLLSIIGPSGRLVSADTDAQAISLARSNSSRFTDADNWELVNSDIHSVQRGDGFDAVFLDLPQPWDYLERASELCRPGGMVVCYSPTYNQVERTLEASRDTHLMLVESCTLRKENIIVRPGSTRPDNNVIGHTGFISFYIRLSGMELQSF